MQAATKEATLPANRKLQRNGHNLPSYDALAEILPEYQYLFRVPKAGLHDTEQHKPRQAGGKGGAAENEQHRSQDSHALNQTYRVQSPHRRPPVPDFEEDPNTAEVTEHQTRELENYRTAMRKMAEDIIALRRQVGGLESENSRLRSELSLHQDLGRTLLEDTDIDVMTKAEIADRIASLKFKLASESNTVTSQRDTIQQLQNELIKKNDGEKELLRLQRAHQQQQAVLQRYQNRLARVTGLEATVRQQEKVIEKMEKVLDSRLKGKNKENAERNQKEGRRREIESVLTAENSRLRAELEKLHLQPAPVIIQQPMQIQEPFPESEKLSLLTQLEKAQARIRSLESQLEENSRRWGREKQDMLTRLSEHDHGFARTSTMILHDLPLKSVSHSMSGPGRRRQLDPLN
ncbi:coiled-coil domain-containing protein 33 [Megalops cyprinoides]|uniref:coiled-coil domain-containing protein 33 n=1 Tax=Megalops cyprinoides TaxID=118141 RepID=UPI001863AD5A|nr:coiled-coil domain-containing protein 33 [Megalops cyprinoides]